MMRLRLKRESVSLSRLAPVVYAFNLILMSACLNVAEDRIARESRVGRAQLRESGMSVEVRDGLAAIRGLSVEGERAQLWLWSQAPSLEIKLTLSDESPIRSLDLRLSNVMRDSELSWSSGELSRDEMLTFDLPTEAHAMVGLSERVNTFHLKPPPPVLGGPWRFALFADVQERIDGLSELLRPLGLEPEVRFVLISGDLTERGSVEALTTFQEQMAQHVPFPCYATLGNHELGTSGFPFYDLFGRGSFSFTYGEARFTLLDGASASIAPSVRRMLDRWLDQSQDQLHVIATHIPLIDPDGTRGGAFASRLESAALLSDLSAHDVDLLLYGHVHTYRYFYQAGIPAVISGGGGSIPMRFDGIGRHYVVFEVDRARAHITHRVAEITPAE